MVQLNKILLNYLDQDQNKIVFADENGSYDLKTFKEKINFYIGKIQHFKKLNSLKKNSNIGVGILLDRNIDYFSIIFASWLTNCFFLPLSKESKKNNINYQLRLSNVAILFENRKKSVVIKKNIFFKKKIFLLNKNNNIAYIIFTSGSTGNKKGVMISRLNVEYYYESIKKITNKISFKSILMTTELNFDMCIGDLVFSLIKNLKLFNIFSFKFHYLI